jgi:hypothetical protein
MQKDLFWSVSVHIINRSALLVLLVGIATVIVGCPSPARPAQSVVGAPTTPTPDLTATAVAVVLDQALAATPAGVVQPLLSATDVFTTTAVALAPTFTLSPQPTATVEPSATVEPTATLTAQPTPTHTPTATPTASPTANATATAGALATTIAVQVQATLAARPSPTSPLKPTPTRAASNQAIVQSDGKLNLREGPGTVYAVVLQIANGVTLQVLGRSVDDDWLQVRAASGEVGWASTRYLAVDQAIAAFPIVAAPPQPTQPPRPASCAIAAADELSSLWNQSEIGCPTSGPSIVWSSWTPYERGMMMWRSDANHVYGFFNSGWWQEVQDVWDGQSATPSRGAPPPGLLEPVRGTGYIWGTNDTFFQELGWARAEEKGFCALVQTFERGFLLRSSSVETCKDNLFNHARNGDFPLDTLVAIQGGGWRASVR